jgi:hypothetical protein
MKEPDLSRYGPEQLTHMLYSYRKLAHEHLEAGHYALAKWCTRMSTLIVIRLGELDAEAEELRERQLALGDEAS